MKKLFIALVLMGTVFANTFAQEYEVVETGEEFDFNNNEVYLTVGTPSGMGLIIGMFSAAFKGIGEAFAKSASGNSTEATAAPAKKNEAAFTLTGGYNYYFTDKFALGAFASYEKFSDFDFFTTQAKITGQYGWEHFKIYHSLSAGIMIVPGSEKAVNFMGDLTWLGLKADFENWTVFVESSIPSTALVKVGASFKF